MKHNDSANYRAQALSSAPSTIPPTMRWTGAIVVSLAIINEVIPPPTTAAYFVGLAAFGATMYLVGVVLERPSTPVWLIP